jgi:hypothetical protein
MAESRDTVRFTAGSQNANGARDPPIRDVRLFSDIARGSFRSGLGGCISNGRRETFTAHDAAKPLPAVHACGGGWSAIAYMHILRQSREPAAGEEDNAKIDRCIIANRATFPIGLRAS